jgi:hypothetical protein
VSSLGEPGAEAMSRTRVYEMHNCPGNPLLLSYVSGRSDAFSLLIMFHGFDTIREFRVNPTSDFDPSFGV